MESPRVEEIMDDVSFDGLARRAARTFDRKTALATFGGLAAAAAVPSAAMEAKDAAKKAKKRCQRQKPQCLAFVRDVICNRAAARDSRLVELVDCFDFYAPCCDEFAECKAAEGFACLLRRQEVPATE